MHKKLFLLVLLSLPLFNACRKENVDPVEGVWVRFKNETGEEIKDAAMHFYASPSVRIGAIPAGQSSDYVYFNSFPVVEREPGDKLGAPEAYLAGKVQDQDMWYSNNLVYDTFALHFVQYQGEFVMRIRKSVKQGYTNRWIEFE